MDSKKWWMIGAIVAAVVIIIVGIVVTSSTLLGPRNIQADNRAPDTSRGNVPGDGDPAGGPGFTPVADVNGDGVVDWDDWTEVAEAFGQQVGCPDPRDLDDDCDVDMTDMYIITDEQKDACINCGDGVGVTGYLKYCPGQDPPTLDFSDVQQIAYEVEPGVFAPKPGREEGFQEIVAALPEFICGYEVVWNDELGLPSSESCDDGNEDPTDGCDNGRPTGSFVPLQDPGDAVCPINDRICYDADFTNDGLIDEDDFFFLLSQFGECQDDDECPADANDDGYVDSADFLLMLAQWHSDSSVKLIYDAAQLNDIRNHALNQNYRLACNIDISELGSEYLFEPIGNDNTPYIGNLEGSGLQISNLNIDTEATEAGLFGEMSGNILRVKLRDVNVMGNNKVGMFAGTMKGTIHQSSACGEVSGENNVGGLVGVLQDGSIHKSFTLGEVTATGTNAGGLVGRMSEDSSVDVSFSWANVFGDSRVGGAIGSIADEPFQGVSNIYSAGSVSGPGFNVGGLVGCYFNEDEECVSGDNPFVSQSYFDTVESGQSQSAGGEGRSTEDMKTYPHDTVDPPIWVGWTFFGDGSENPNWVHQDGVYPWLKYLNYQEYPF